MSSDDQSDKECPLCMEAFDIDDINFYPCNCQYQICRFCWHRIRTNENGLCPACRQSYPEDPVNFQPLSSADLQKIKSEKKQKVQQQKNKVVESRKHLAEFRVLQKNLVYAVGLSQRMADPDLLKKPEFFGKFGKIIKVAVGAAPAINSTQPAVHTAYITYARNEDALRAIHAVNNMVVESRFLKASLGTTKYCSNFLKGQACHKPECMYLHEVAEEEISFTKDDMHQGKHTEYERRLHEQMASASGGGGKKATQPPPLQQQSSFGSGRELAALRNKATASAREQMEKKRGGGGGSLENLPTATSGKKAAGQKQQQRIRQSAKAAAAATSAAVGWGDQQQQQMKGRGGSETRELLRSSRTENAKNESKHGSNSHSSKNINTGGVGKSVSPPLTQVIDKGKRELQLQRTESAEESHHYNIKEEEETPMDPSPTIMAFTSIDDRVHWSELDRSASSPAFPSSAQSQSQLVADLMRLNGDTDGIVQQPQQLKMDPQHQRIMAAKNYFLEDDDLGFDPFAESSKALEEIMEEEKNHTPPTSIAPNHLHNGSIGGGHSSSSYFIAGNSLFTGQQNCPPPGLQHPSPFTSFSQQNNNHHFGGGLGGGQHNSMSDLRESFKALLPNVNVRFIADAAANCPQQEQRQPGYGEFFGTGVDGGTAGTTSTSSLPALPSSHHGNGPNRSFGNNIGQFRSFVLPTTNCSDHHSFQHFQQQHQFGGPPISHQQHHSFLQPSPIPPFGGVQQQQQNGPFNAAVGTTSSFSSGVDGFQHHPFHHQQPLPPQHSSIFGGAGGGGSTFQQQQEHQLNSSTAQSNHPHNHHQQQRNDQQQQHHGWLPVPPGFSPRTEP